MVQARIENGIARCPFCGTKKFEIYRRTPEESGNVFCLARCQKCDDTFSVIIDKYDNPVAEPVDNEDYPDLPFDGES